MMTDDQEDTGEEKKPVERNRLKRRSVAMQAKDELVSELFERCDTLKREVLRAQKLRLQELAVMYPQYPELAAVVEKMGLDIDRERIETEMLLRQLPRSFTWAGRHSQVRYAPRFLREMFELEPAYRQHVVFKLKQLIEQGPDSPNVRGVRAPREVADLPFASNLLEVAANLYVCWRKNTRLIIDALYSPPAK